MCLIVSLLYIPTFRHNVSHLPLLPILLAQHNHNGRGNSLSFTHSLTHYFDFVLHMLVLNLLKCVLCCVDDVAEEEEWRRKRQQQGERRQHHHRRLEGRNALRRLRFQNHQTPPLFPRLYLLPHTHETHFIFTSTIYGSIWHLISVFL